MEESFDSYFDSETLSLVMRFESMHENQSFSFFDIDEYEEIIDYYFYKNDQRKAIQTIRIGLDQHPGHPLLLIREAQYLVNKQQDHKALRILRDIREMPHIDGDLLLAMGNLYSQLENPEKAIECFLLAAPEVDYLDDIYSNIAFEYESMGQYNKAITYLLKTLEINPEHETALYEFAFCCEVSQQSQRSISFFQEFTDKNPYSAPGWFNLGIAYSNMDLFEKAIEAYDFVLAIDDSFSSAHFNKANCQANLSQFKEAIATYEETFLYEEPEPVTYYYIGECYEKLKDFPKAMEYYQQSVKKEPEFADGWLGIGIIHDELGEPSSALTFIKKAIKLSPNIPEYWFIRGDIEIKLGLIQEGIQSYRKVIELNPEDEEIWLDLSVVYADRKEFAIARETLQEGLHYHRSNADFYFGLGYYHYMSGKSQQGKELILKGIEIDPKGYDRLISTFPEAANHSAIVNLVAINIKR